MNTQSFSTSDGMPNKFFSNPAHLNMNKLSSTAAPQTSQHRYITPAVNVSAIEHYNNCGGGLATLDRVQYYPNDPPRYRNNNEECRSNEQCASGYCNMTIDVDNGLPSDLQPVLPPSVDVMMDVNEKYGNSAPPPSSTDKKNMFLVG
jgi:hypothetical protein